NAISTLGNVTKRVNEGAKISTLADALIAKAPGVIVLPASTLGGAPTVRVRGVSSISLTNSPIYYVDGVRYNSGTLASGTDTQYSLLNSLSADEIEDIEIVKGPSAATLYGTNAANGVVLITTKKGTSGATHWNWIAELGTVRDRTDYQPQYANFGHAPGSTVPLRCQRERVTHVENRSVAQQWRHADVQSPSSHRRSAGSVVLRRNAELRLQRVPGRRGAVRPR